MSTLITVVHIITCVLLVLVVMIQSGKGAEISASFGGSSQTVFGSSGGANFFQKFTFGAAAVFMVTSLLLTIAGGQSRKSLFEGAPATAPLTTTTNPGVAPSGAAPAAPSGAAAPAQNTAPAQNAAPATAPSGAAH